MLKIPLPTLRDGERVVWQARAGESLETMSVAPWLVAGALLLGLVGLLRITVTAANPAAVLALVVPIAVFLVAGALVWVRPRLGPVYHLTTERLIVWVTMRQRFVSIPLASIRRATRHVAVSYSGHRLARHRSERVTSEIEIWQGDERTTFGPLADPDELLELIDDAVLGRVYALEDLPDVRGLPAPGEAREDVLLVIRPRSGGPLFVGPTTVVVWTAPLPQRELGLLCASATIADVIECEGAVRERAREPSATIADECPRVSAAPRIIDGALHLRMDERETVVRLLPDAAARADRVLRASDRSAFR